MEDIEKQELLDAFHVLGTKFADIYDRLEKIEMKLEISTSYDDDNYNFFTELL